MPENASLKIWNALEPLIKREIERQTRNCQRMKSMMVSTDYSAQTGVVGVTEAFGKEIFLPVISTLDKSKLVAGASVWVCMPYSSMSNAVVTMMGDGNNGYSAKELLGAVYPVGSLYMSVNATEPSVLFGGTWERLKDRFLLAAGDTYAAGATGGEAAHTLTVEEMANHNHLITRSGTVSSGNVVLGAPGPYQDGNFASLGITGVDAVATTEFKIAYTGYNVPHNNMPPYIAVYVWKRTA